MKTDYTLTPEFEEAQRHIALYRLYAGMQNVVGRESPELMTFIQCALMNDTRPETYEQNRQAMQSTTFGVAFVDPIRNRCADLKISHDIGEPLARTVGKIAARILFVLLLVGTLVGVML